MRTATDLNDGGGTVAELDKGVIKQRESVGTIPQNILVHNNIPKY